MPSQHTSRTTALTFGSCASTELLVYVPTWMIESMDGMVCVYCRSGSGIANDQKTGTEEVNNFT